MANTPVTRGFSIANMKDDYESAFEALYSGIQDQNPEVDYDTFDMELRRLVMRFGGTNSTMQKYPAFAGLVEAADEPIEAVYNEAADIISLAHTEYKQGHRNRARQLFEASMESDDIATLIDALQINNSKSKIGLQATDEDEETLKDGLSVPLNDDDDDQSDSAIKPDEDNELEINSDEEDSKSSSPIKKSSEDEDESDNDDDSTPMGSISSNKMDIVRIAAANKLSQSGSRESLIKARRLAS